MDVWLCFQTPPHHQSSSEHISALIHMRLPRLKPCLMHSASAQAIAVFPAQPHLLRYRQCLKSASLQCYTAMDFRKQRRCVSLSRHKTHWSCPLWANQEIRQAFRGRYAPAGPIQNRSGVLWPQPEFAGVRHTSLSFSSWNRRMFDFRPSRFHKPAR